MEQAQPPTAPGQPEHAGRADRPVRRHRRTHRRQPPGTHLARLARDHLPGDHRDQHHADAHHPLPRHRRPRRAPLRTALPQPPLGPVDRIRSVDLDAKPMHRLFGLTSLRIGTGEQSSSSSRKLSLDGITKQQAGELRRLLLDRRGNGAATGQVEDLTIAEMDWAWLRYAPLTVWGVGSVFAGVGTAYRILHEMKIDPLELGIVKDLEDRFGSVPCGSASSSRSSSWPSPVSPSPPRPSWTPGPTTAWSANRTASSASAADCSSPARSPSRSAGCAASRSPSRCCCAGRAAPA